MAVAYPQAERERKEEGVAAAYPEAERERKEEGVVVGDSSSEAEREQKEEGVAVVGKPFFPRESVQPERLVRKLAKCFLLNEPRNRD